MFSSSLGSKKLHTAALCAVLLFMPAASCAWLDQKPTARNQAFISAAVLVAAPLVDGILRNAGTLGSVAGWKKLPRAIKRHIAQSVFAEGIESRREDENFFAHKARVAGTYAAENPVFLIALALVAANATHSLWTEFDRLEKNQNPDAEKLKKAEADLKAANESVADLTAKLTTATQDKAATVSEKEALQQQLDAAVAAQGTAERALATLDATHKTCAGTLQAEKDKHAGCAGQLTAVQQQLRQVQRDHQGCGTASAALTAQIRELEAALAAATKGTGAAAADPLTTESAAGAPAPVPASGGATDLLGGAAALASARAASALKRAAPQAPAATTETGSEGEAGSDNEGGNGTGTAPGDKK